jgi:hypothetical protein
LAEQEDPGLEMSATQEQTGRIHPGVAVAAATVGEAVHRLVRERLAAGTPPLDPFRGLHLDDADVERLLTRTPLDQFGDGTSAKHVPLTLPRRVESSPLGVAQRGLSLSDFEVAVLVLCLLPEIDGSYGPLIGFLHDDVTRKQPTVELALSLFAPDGPERLDSLHAFAAGSNLRAWQLIQMPQEEALIRQPLHLDRAFLWFLLGEPGLDTGLTDVAHVRASGQTAQAVVSPALEAMLTGEGAVPPVLMYGEDEQACLAMASAAARVARRPLLVIDGGRLAETEMPASTLQRCLREAVLKGFLPCVSGASAVLQHASSKAAACRQVLLDCPLPVVLTTESSAGEVPFGGRGVVPLVVSAPTAASRLERWREAAGAHEIVDDERTLLALAEATVLSDSAIDEVVAVAAATAQTSGEAPNIQHVQQAARGVLRQRASSLTLTTPRFCWDDIVLPPDRLHLLRHLCSRVRYRSHVRETWGMGHGSLPGVTALFAGEPGTGKSMAAEVIATDLGLDLCKIDLSQVVSKYIGETEKNLARIFAEAEGCGVVLVFDEADALFGKRSAVRDSHDRYANLEISYLLQRMERYRGLAVLTTNLRSNLDEAFTRRIGVSVSFPMPGAPDRLRIWQRALADAPCDAQLTLSDLAERLELAGGAIVNVAVAAAHLAAEDGGMIDGDRLVRAMRWELQKMGRLMDNDALDALTPLAASPNGRGGK